MYGVLDAVASGPIDARISENSTMVMIYAVTSNIVIYISVSC